MTLARIKDTDGVNIYHGAETYLHNERHCRGLLRLDLIHRIKSSGCAQPSSKHLGSVAAGTDAAGTLLWTEHHSPYGEPLSPNAANDNEATFTGHIWDKATGLNYMQARYYDPVIGRFLSIDPIDFTPANPGTFNRYTYALNNPVNHTDPSGECVPGLCPADIAMSRAAIKQDAGSFAKGVGRGVLQSVAATLDVAAAVSPTYSNALPSPSQQLNAAMGPAENASMAIGEMQGQNAGNAAQVAAGPAGAAKAGTTVVAKTSQSVIQGFTKHGVNQAINRGVKPGAMLDAVKNPLKVGPVQVNNAGLQSQRFTGGQASVVVNPQSGKVVTVNPTSTKTAERLRRQNE